MYGQLQADFYDLSGRHIFNRQCKIESSYMIEIFGRHVYFVFAGEF